MQQGWDALDKPMCESLYPQGPVSGQRAVLQLPDPGTAADPRRGLRDQHLVGLRGRVRPASSNYPAAYKGSLFFSDYARSCVWRLGRKPNGDPDPTVILPFVQHAATPVDLVIGPGGDLFYVDYGLDDGVPTEKAGGIHRIGYRAQRGADRAIGATPTSGPLAATFSAAAATDPHGGTLTYAWDLDGNGGFDDDRKHAARKYAAGTYNVGLRVDDGHGHTSTATQQIQPGNTAPVLGTVTPDPALNWSVGQTINFSATASDPAGHPPASAFSWDLAIRHCPATCATRTTSAPSRGSRRGASRHPTTSTLRTSC